MLNCEPTSCAGVHEEIEAAKDVFYDLAKHGKYAEAVEHLYTEKAIHGVGGTDLSPARAGACTRAHTSMQRTGVLTWLNVVGDSPVSDTATTQALGERYAQQVGRCSIKNKDGTTQRWWYVCSRLWRACPSIAGTLPSTRR